ncbi:MAG: lipoate--protein ligase family protein [Haloarculaceae archaeon]
MRVLRGRGPDVERDHDRTRDLVARVAERRVPALRVWTSHRQVAFGRRDANRKGYERARKRARERGYAVVERSVGGRAVAFTGSTVAFVLAEPVETPRGGIQHRYDRVAATVRAALAACGADLHDGEPPDSFCPGSHSLRHEGKVVGLAQRVRQQVAVTAGVVVVDDPGAVADVLEPVYAALNVPFDPGSVGSVARAGGPADPRPVARALEGALVGGRPVTVARVRDT